MSIATLLFFFLPVCAAPQEPGNSTKDANEFARQVLANEVKAEAEDHSHWMFKLETETPHRNEADEVVETADGDLKRPVLINGRSPTAKQEHDADEQIQRLVSDSTALHKSRKEENQDAARSQRLLKMLPEALIFQFGEHRGDAVELHFTPNPHFRPATREARVFQAMNGEMWVNSKQARLMEITGHLVHVVKFGGGVLGHLNSGGQFEVKQTEVTPGFWELTLLDVNMKGKALFFKTIGVQQKVHRTDFRQVSDDLTPVQAAHLLRKQPVVARSAGTKVNQ